MTKEIYEPLAEYRDVFRERFKQVAEETFAELANEPRFRKIVERLYRQEEI